MPVIDSKFSNFADGGDLALDDIVVGLRGGINTRFSFSGSPPGVYLPISGGTMLGAIDMGGNAIINLEAPSLSTDAATKGYIDTTLGGYLPLSGGTVTGNVVVNNLIPGYVTTVTAAGLTTLTVNSAYQQFFTGSSTQTIKMPVTSTLILGASWYFVNKSTGNITIQSSGANNIQVMAPGTNALITCVLTSGTSAASWNTEYAFNGGEGSGTVNAGTANDLAYYATSGTAVSPLASGTNGVLVTDGSGVPSISTTLPSDLAATAMALTTPTITGSITMTNGQSILDQNGQSVITIGSTTSAVNSLVVYNNSTGLNPTIGAIGADTNISLELYYKGTGAINILGTNTNSNAASQIVGEYISSSVLIGSAVSVSNNVAKTITSISLTAGDWDVAGTIAMNPAGSTTSSYQIAGISTTTNTLPTIGAENNTQSNNANIGAGGNNVLGVGTMRISLAATTTVYLVAQAGFAVSTMTVYGFIGARRVR